MIFRNTFQHIVSDSRCAKMWPKVIAFVSCTTFENLTLWRANDEKPNNQKLTWNHKFIADFEIGKIDDHPVQISFNFTEYGGHIICFYENLSHLSDKRMVHACLDHLKRLSHYKCFDCDALNFHLVTHTIHDLAGPSED